jgi:7,8-dihydropterin-6-yl-methyl-4-(beta-D-ribofuranosyl)aminobenzene 5'-phosphate synthase
MNEKDVFEEKESPEVRIKILYNDFLENNSSNNEFLAPDHGFSLLVEVPGAKILFDAGQNFNVLSRNMLNLNLKAEEINFVFLSHYHKDHFGGLFDFLRSNYNVTVFLTKDFPNDFKQRIINSGASLVEIKKLSTLFNNVATTGPMGTLIKEQSLIIMTSKGVVIITGCAHQGLAELVGSVKILEANILAIVGGFHLFEKSEEETRKIAEELKNLGIKNVVPLHCSGENAVKIFRDVFKENFISAGLGSTLEF